VSTSLFEHYGGFAKISRVVSDFYERMLDSPNLASYFKDTNMRRLVDHQTKFIASLMGGPAEFSNEALERSHARLNIDQASFDEMLGLLAETLEDFDFEDSDIKTLMSEMKSRSKYIITR
jgi:hemoglobin